MYCTLFLRQIYMEKICGELIIWIMKAVKVHKSVLYIVLAGEIEGSNKRCPLESNFDEK